MAAPTVTTDSISIGVNTGLGVGTITATGGKTVSACGICVKTSANPTVSDTCFASTTLTGTFTSAISGLSATTDYHARAYATNADGTGYGADTPFTTGTPTAAKLLYQLGII